MFDDLHMFQQAAQASRSTLADQAVMGVWAGLGVGRRWVSGYAISTKVGRISRRRNPTHPTLKSDTPTIPSTCGFLHHFHEGGFGAGEAAAAGYFFAAEA